MSRVALAGRDPVVGAGAGARDALLTALRRTGDVLVFMLVTGAIVAGLSIAALLAMTLSALVLTSGPLSRGGPGVFLAIVIGVAAVVMLAYLSVRWALAYPVLAVEVGGWRSALVRSWRLSTDGLWRLFLVIVTGTLTSAFIAAFMAQLAAVVLVDLLAIPAGLDPVVGEIVALALGSVLLAPLMPVLLATAYHQLGGDAGPG
jgi:hypothetical protein